MSHWPESVTQTPCNKKTFYSMNIFKKQYLTIYNNLQYVPIGIDKSYYAYLFILSLLLLLLL